MRQLRSIQYLRGIAAVMVLMTHVFRNADVLTDYHFIGAGGVDIFFVISGFLMWSITSKSDQTSPQFFVDRLARIVPLYWITTLAIVCFASFTMFYSDADTAPLHVVKSLLFIPDYDHLGRIVPTLLVGWTLNFEMAFYALFAVALLPPRKWRIVIVAAPLLILPFLGLLLAPTHPISVTYTSPIILEFLGGVLLGVFFAQYRVPNKQACHSMIAFGALGFLASCLLPDEEGSWLRIIVWGIPAVALIAGAIGLERLNALPNFNILLTLGDASYSLYLTHALSVRAVNRAMKLIFSSSHHEILLVIASVIGAIGIALIIYRTIENPIRRFLKMARRSFAVTDSSRRSRFERSR